MLLVYTALCQSHFAVFLTSAPFALWIFGISWYCRVFADLLRRYVLCVCACVPACVRVWVGVCDLFVLSDSDRPVLYLCTLQKESCQHSRALSQQARLLQSTCVTGKKTMYSERALCRPSQLSSFVPGEHFIHLLCKHFTYLTSQGLISPHLCNSKQKQLELEWVLKLEKLPQDEYEKCRTVPGNKSVPSDDIVNNDTQGLLAGAAQGVSGWGF